MEISQHKIYCAGPLFNPKEKEEMEHIAVVLEEAGYSVFLPQRDGLEYAEFFPFLLNKDIPQEKAQMILNLAIFSLDVFQILDSSGLLLNMNGRVPDEGAMVEAGIAWAHNKAIVIFKSDSRSLMHGSCNPLVMGLADFNFVTTYKEIATVLGAKLSFSKQEALLGKETGFETSKRIGEEISNYLTAKKPESEIADLLIDLFREKICNISEDQKLTYTKVHTQQ